MPATKKKNPPHSPAKAPRSKGVYDQGPEPTPKKTARKKPITCVGLYARVSTHDQQTLPMQVKAMKQHARRRGWSVELIVEDVGSGASRKAQAAGISTGRPPT